MFLSLVYFNQIKPSNTRINYEGARIHFLFFNGRSPLINLNSKFCNSLCVFIGSVLEVVLIMTSIQFRILDKQFVSRIFRF